MCTLKLQVRSRLISVYCHLMQEESSNSSNKWNPEQWASDLWFLRKPANHEERKK
jgi:hypothetical protein